MKVCQCQWGRGLLPCVLAVVLCLFGTGRVSGGVKVVQTITGEQAQQHLQETNTVCGVVASTKYAERSREKHTYLNFDRPFPEQTFTAVVTEAARAKFKAPPEVVFDGKNVCVTGLITESFHGKPQIVVEDPSQIQIADPAPPAASPSGQGSAR